MTQNFIFSFREISKIQKARETRQFLNNNWEYGTDTVQPRCRVVPLRCRRGSAAMSTWFLRSADALPPRFPCQFSRDADAVPPRCWHGSATVLSEFSRGADTFLRGAAVVWPRCRRGSAAVLLRFDSLHYLHFFFALFRFFFKEIFKESSIRETIGFLNEGG